MGEAWEGRFCGRRTAATSLADKDERLLPFGYRRDVPEGFVFYASDFGSGESDAPPRTVAEPPVTVSTNTEEGERTGYYVASTADEFEFLWVAAEKQSQRGGERCPVESRTAVLGFAIRGGRQM